MAGERRQDIAKRAFNWTPRERSPSASTVGGDLGERLLAQRFPVFADTGEDGGSTPPAPTTQALTSANAGQVGARGRFSGPRSAEGTVDGRVVDETTYLLTN